MFSYALANYSGTVGTLPNVSSLTEKPASIPMIKATLNSSSFGGRLKLSSKTRKGMFLKCAKASESTLEAVSDGECLTYSIMYLFHSLFIITCFPPTFFRKTSIGAVDA